MQEGAARNAPCCRGGLATSHLLPVKASSVIQAEILGVSSAWRASKVLQAPLPDTTASQSRGAPILPGRAASPVLTGPPGAAWTTGIEASNAHTEAQGIQNPSQRGIFTQSLAELTPQVSAEQRWLPPARHRCSPAKEWGNLQPPWEGQAMPPTLPQGCCPSSCISAAQFSPTKPPVGSNGVVVARGHRSPPVRAAGGCSKKQSRTGMSERNSN